MDKYSIETTHRNGKLLISINLGNRSVGSLFLLDEDENFLDSFRFLIETWNKEKEVRL